ncbi:MAG: glycogen-debranching protein [Parachlamydiales bacterium]|nr:glycogen-debranching protein [Parachlamydiales bacterium]
MEIQVHKGVAKPLGTSKIRQGINFSVYALNASKVTLVLTDHDGNAHRIELDPNINKTDQLWHVCVKTKGIENWQYHYIVQNDKNIPPFPLIDPYAKALSGPSHWGETPTFTTDVDQALNNHPKGIIMPVSHFSWRNDKFPRHPAENLIIYEMHVRGFTQHDSSQVQSKGTFLGMIEKIPYLKDLGINAVELQPITYFNESEYNKKGTEGQRLYNYWGYSPFAYFALMNRYATHPDQVIVEFKALVKALHKAGIEVICDLVYNHTAEGGQAGPMLSLKGLASDVYYIKKEDDHSFMDFTGCGNTINANNPVTQELILDSLRYFVQEFHVDGFRFDLGSCFTRGLKGEVLDCPPVVKAMAEDPILKDTKLIMEAWDATGLYQVGTFPNFGRIADWNGRYRDQMRRYIKGSEDGASSFATRICGSQDLYNSAGKSTFGINFITCHDGFTLRDLVSYNDKHNEKNAEENRDGNNSNDSWNCGVEGETKDPAILKLRQKQMRNYHLALLVSQGIPMLLMRDEYCHTKYGNNNTWCHDSELNWMLWDEIDKNSGFYRFYKKMIHFRKNHPLLGRSLFLTDKDVAWHGKTPNKPDWSPNAKFIAFMLKDYLQKDVKSKRPIYVAFNTSANEVDIELPVITQKHWNRLVDTSLDSPNDFLDDDKAVNLKDRHYKMAPYSAILLIGY